jgi:glycosyltransferase involved in cell wall biosynthesis
METRISVILPTRDPDAGRLARSLEALRTQSLDPPAWELIIVDNGSANPVSQQPSWCGRTSIRVVREERPGLTYARLRGVAESRGDIIVFVDDDNVLQSNYLRNAKDAFESNAAIGIVGGRSIPEYEQDPPQWLSEFMHAIACRDFGDRRLVSSWPDVTDSSRRYPEWSPIGAGMAVRRQILESYAEALHRDPKRATLDRCGKSLASGGDNDIVMTALENGWSVAYDPELVLMHLIPSSRMQPKYIANLSEASSRTWVQVLDAHGLRPWRPVLPGTGALLKTRMYLKMRAWRTIDSYIRWRGYCGLVDGRSTLGDRS